MLDWFFSNISTILILLVLAIVIVLIIINIHHSKKKGKLCGGRCTSCPNTSFCKAKTYKKSKEK